MGPLQALRRLAVEKLQTSPDQTWLLVLELVQEELDAQKFANERLTELDDERI